MNIQRMKIVSVVWGLLLFSLVSVLTVIGFIYKEKKKEYKNYELLIEETAEKYVEDKSLFDDNLKIDIEELLNNGYLDTTYVNNEKCEGYVLMMKVSNHYDFNGYIKCSNYTTKGYDK